MNEPTWKLYRVETGDTGRPQRAVLGYVPAATGRKALERYAADNGLKGQAQGRSAYAVLGFGLIRAEKVRRRTPDGSLPPVEEMRAVLAARDHNDANLISATAVELRYRANVLGERMTGPQGELARRDNREEETMEATVEGTSGKELAKTLIGQLKQEVAGVKVKKTKAYERAVVGKRTVAVVSVTKSDKLHVEVPVGATRRPAETFKPQDEAELAAVVAATKQAAEAVAA